MDQDAQAMSKLMSFLQREMCNQRITTTKEEKKVNANARPRHAVENIDYTSVRTVEAGHRLLFTLRSRGCKKSVCALRVVQENNDTHVLPMMSLDLPHLQYHGYQVWVLIVDEHRSWW